MLLNASVAVYRRPHEPVERPLKKHDPRPACKGLADALPKL
ncbi:hypothetical protein Poly24_22720 [Rosistilla carotiformis]|uniref:Uncharacterized protein n=1 Tax=Rosistilla carotiformis TaxID=2528017 RepID=A0A518JSP6_9BACT|nr:hypothetical protein Poly24_22720 [Rosistilla carotiformis]